MRRECLAVHRSPDMRSSGCWLRVSLAIQCAKNPLLQDSSKIWLYFAKHQTHAGRLDIEDGCVGLEIFSRMMNFQQDMAMHLNPGRRLQIASAQAHLRHTRGKKSSGRALRSNLGTGAESKP
jgi:hypothetical protein